ncbi:MAG: fibronectin type III domain-containing protein [Anaerolineae bacterium]
MRHHKVYVALGFHVNCYHSWRGDTPDEAGFGTDIRIMREILRMLNDANRCGLQARGYWDWEVYYSVQQILPRHAADILAGVRARVAAGLDEIVLGPYNNGANHAATEAELRTAIAYALRNPFGSGLEQVFGRVAPIYRPQEMMLTPGHLTILQQEGVEAVILLYASVPFNSLSTFVPTLPLAQRYNPLWLRTPPDETRLILLPCISAGDIIEHVSFEALLLHLRAEQVAGRLNSDVLVHINEDADLESWLPVRVPQPLAWFPNTGGLEEFIRVVNRYPWAHFTVPSAYLRDHPPVGEIVVRQDLADGGFDGNYSWAEKYTSLHNWTLVERSRLASYRAMALLDQLAHGQRPAALCAHDLQDLRSRLWQGADSAFFQRLVGLTTTHFGMSTPVINEERQAAAEAMLGQALAIAAEVERTAADAVRQATAVARDAPYVIQVTGLTPCDPSLAENGCQPRGAASGSRSPAPSTRPHTLANPTVPVLIRVPLVLPPGVTGVAAAEAVGKALPAALADRRPLPDGRQAAELLLLLEPTGAEQEASSDRRTIYVQLARQPQAAPARPLDRLRNPWLDVQFSETHGIAALSYCGEPIGGADFLAPFVTYREGRPRTWSASRFTLVPLAGESWERVGRARLETTIPLRTRDGEFVNRFHYTFTLFDDLPWLFLDVEAVYAATPKRDLIESFVQKLRRLIDLRWIEVAPCQLHPRLTAPATEPLRVWKHNHLGITGYYDLNYGAINPQNRNLDSFNHQVTASWVAVSDRRRGLLLAQSAEVLASMAFCPMRLRQAAGIQSIWLNPFGSYYGRQLDYRHVGHHGVGAAITRAVSGSLRPNAPSFNGQTVRFSLMLAPYHGDEPPAELQATAMAFFYPPALVYLRTPPGPDALPGPRSGTGPRLADDVREEIGRVEREAALLSDATLAPPCSLLANPLAGAIDLTWDAPPDPRVTGYELRWRPADADAWETLTLPPCDRWHLEGLQDGRPYVFQLAALAPRARSPWTPAAEGVPGAVDGKAGLRMLRRVPAPVIARMLLESICAVVRHKPEM